MGAAGVVGAYARVLWQHPLPAVRGYAYPIVYRTAGTEYVMSASDGGDTAELVAFSIGGR